MARNFDQIKVPQKKEQNFFAVEDDIWESGNKKRKPVIPEKRTVIPAVVIPEGGESYNPS